MKNVLVVDVGNTNVVLAVFQGENCRHHWRIFTDVRKTAEEYSVLFRSLFDDGNFSFSPGDEIVLSTVVPQLREVFISALKNLSGKKPLVVDSSIYGKLPLTIGDSVAAEIGTDLVANALAGYVKYKGGVIVVDFGTALSFTAVSSTGEIAGVAIAPGLGTAVSALWGNAAQLPSVTLCAPKSSLGRNTVESMQSGIVLGYKYLIQGLIGEMKEDLKKQFATDSVKVVATGGLSEVIFPITDIFFTIDKDLTLMGLRLMGDFVQ